MTYIGEHSQAAKDVAEYIAERFNPDDRIVATWFSVEDINLAIENEDIDGDNPALMEWASDNAEDLWTSFVQSRALEKEMGYLFEAIREAVAHHIESEFKRNQFKTESKAGN